ncbi:hypothetical protein [Skermania piniformis]|uniref:Uncharacterized protein n=1 Tax=Skermania pinensis TaxID=39122 RepID=A0ABX8S6Z7_9ACTN|nr:hypothetical protein [Skermania piniformis]QXQ12797.1 hypothetical protein KV203_12750 [Skermania piniformis]
MSAPYLPSPQPLIPGIDQVVANLQSLPVITGKPEQFVGPAGSGPPDLSALPQ